MSKKNIEKHIPTALKVLEKIFGDAIPSAYNGYISSFGASIMQSGLKPTLALFENENAKTLKKKEILTSVIMEILEPSTNETSLLKYVINSKDDETHLKKQILDISIAIKLSIRTFKLKKD
jgi:CRISPR-associated protein Cmr5